MRKTNVSSRFEVVSLSMLLLLLFLGKFSNATNECRRMKYGNESKGKPSPDRTCVAPSPEGKGKGKSKKSKSPKSKSKKSKSSKKKKSKKGKSEMKEKSKGTYYEPPSSETREYISFEFMIDLGWQGSAFILDDEDIVEVEQCVLGVVIGAIDGDDVHTECADLNGQLSITIEETIDEFGPQRRLGAVRGEGSTGARFFLVGRCYRCSVDRLTSDVVNVINTRTTRSKRSKGTKGKKAKKQPRRTMTVDEEEEPQSELLLCLKERLPELFDPILRDVAEPSPPDDPCLTNLESLLTCLNNNYIVSELGHDPVLKCHHFNDFRCRERLKPIGITEKQCRKHVPMPRPTRPPRTPRPTKPPRTPRPTKPPKTPRPTRHPRTPKPRRHRKPNLV